ncbi:MAG: hypothetical protein KBD37_02985 [Burkholderiales bacterium]|nr:hypothetical protein [Burkholderiales bacterium]
MAKLVKCKLCKKDISSSAKKCPHCGEKQEKYTILVVFAVILGLIIIAGKCSNDNSANPAPQNGIEESYSSSSPQNTIENNSGTSSSKMVSEVENEETIWNENPEKSCTHEVYIQCIKKCKKRFNNDVYASICDDCSNIAGKIPSDSLKDITKCIGYYDAGWMDNHKARLARNVNEFMNMEIFKILKSNKNDSDQIKTNKKTQLLNIYNIYLGEYNDTLKFWSKLNGKINNECYTAWYNMKVYLNKLTLLDQEKQSGIITDREYQTRYTPQDKVVFDKNFSYLIANCNYTLRESQNADDLSNNHPRYSDSEYIEYGKKHNLSIP